MELLFEFSLKIFLTWGKMWLNNHSEEIFMKYKNKKESIVIISWTITKKIKYTESSHSPQWACMKS